MTPKTKTSFAFQQVLAFGQRITRLEEEVRAINADKAEVYREAKLNGYDVPALKVAIRKWIKTNDDPNAVQEQEAIVDLYLAALSGKDTTETAQDRTAVAANSVLEAPTRTRTNEHPEPTSQSAQEQEGEGTSPLSLSKPIQETVTEEVKQPEVVDDDLEVPNFLDRRKPAHGLSRVLP